MHGGCSGSSNNWHQESGSLEDRKIEMEERGKPKFPDQEVQVLPRAVPAQDV